MLQQCFSRAWSGTVGMDKQKKNKTLLPGLGTRIALNAHNPR